MAQDLRGLTSVRQVDSSKKGLIGVSLIVIGERFILRPQLTI